MSFHRSSIVTFCLATAAFCAGAASATSAAPDRADNARLADIIGNPITTYDRQFRRHLIERLDRSDRDRRHGKPESVWRKEREQAVLDVLRRPESRDFTVRNTFSALLRRAPDAAELRNVGRTIDAADSRAATSLVASSDEYFAKAGSGTNAGFVKSLYRDTVAREIDATTSSTLVRRLASGETRTTIVQEILDGKEYRERIVNDLYRSRGLGFPGIRRFSEGVAVLDRSDGYYRLLASVQASDEYARTALSDPGLGSNPASGVPLAPQLGLGSSWKSIAQIPPDDFKTQSVAAAPDDSLWRNGTDGVFVYDPQLARWSATSVPSAGALAPVSAKQAWATSNSNDGLPALVLYNVDGTYTAYPGPNECFDAVCIVSLSATALPSRGVLWAVTDSNHVYTFTSTGTAGSHWTQVPNNGYAITSVSGVGAESASVDAYALAGTQALKHTADGWAPVEFFKGSNVNWIQGTADGAAWALTNFGGNALLVELRPDGDGSWKDFSNVKTPSTNLSDWAPGGQAASSRDRMFALFFDKDTNTDYRYAYSAFSVGVVDQPAQGFPPFTGTQQQAYDAISVYCQGGVVKGGLRSSYDDAASTFSIWEGDIASETRIPQPSNVTNDDWKAVKKQLAKELQYVKATANLFNNGIIPTNTAIETLSTGQLSNAVTAVGLQTVDPKASVGMWFANLFVNVFSNAVADFGLPGAVAGGVISSVMGSAVSALFPDSPSLNPLPAAYSDLSNNVTNMYEQTNKLAAAYYKSVVKDWGRLKRVGSLLDLEVWKWDYTQAQAIAADTVDGQTLWFYQTLFPVKWQIVHTRYGDYVQYPWQWTPDYDTYQVPCSSCSVYAMPAEHVWFANRLNGPVNLNDDLGPFPQPTLFDNLFNFNADMDSFWRSLHGWTTKQVEATE